VAWRRAGKYDDPTIRPISSDNSHTFIAHILRPGARHEEAAQAFKEQLLEPNATTAYLGVMSEAQRVGSRF
jgi:hypothetical protein